jgi:hypothetical protein
MIKVSAKAIFRGPWALAYDFDNDSKNSAPSSKASGGQTLSGKDD